MKAVGSLVPTHFHNQVHREEEEEGGTERESQRVSPLSVLIPSRRKMRLLAVPAGEEDSSRKENGFSSCWSLSFFPHSAPPSLCLY